MLIKSLLFGVIAAHLFWVMTVSTGAILAVSGWLHRAPKLQTGYVFLVLVTMIGDLVYRQCPLTLWELRLRLLDGQVAPTQGFIERLLGSVFGPVDPATVTLVGVSVLSIGLAGVVFWNSWELAHA